jgi:glycosyltransferase involved in cell wall biosynthesis
MKILQISAFPPENPGGSEQYAYLICKTLAKLGHEVHLLTSRFLNARKEEVKAEHCLMIKRIPSLGLLFNINPITFIMNELIKESGWADVVHVHGGFFFTTLQTILLRIFKQIPVIVHVHESLDYSNISSSTIEFKKNLWDPTIQTWILNNSDVIASVSKKNIKIIRDRLGIREKPIYWIPNAIDTRAFQPKVCKVFRGIVGFVGRLVYWKGIESFLSSARIVLQKDSGAKFIIIGGGPLLRRLKEIYRNERRIRFIGYIPPQLISHALDSIDILVSPSYLENVPTILLQAMAKGIPVIASKVGGIPEIVKENLNGFLINPKKVEEIADKILFLLNNPKEARRMGENGRIVVQNNYDIDIVIKKVIEVYESICRK